MCRWTNIRIRTCLADTCFSGASWTELPQNRATKVKIYVSGFVRTKSAESATLILCDMRVEIITLLFLSLFARSRHPNIDEEWPRSNRPLVQASDHNVDTSDLYATPLMSKCWGTSAFAAAVQARIAPTHGTGQGCHIFTGKGPQSLMWSGSRAARVNVTINYIPNLLLHYSVIFMMHV